MSCFRASSPTGEAAVLAPRSTGPGSPFPIRKSRRACANCATPGSSNGNMTVGNPFDLATTQESLQSISHDRYPSLLTDRGQNC